MTFLSCLKDLNKVTFNNVLPSLECDEDHPCQGLGEHAHFRSFGMAFLTLFRIATGNLKHCIRLPILIFQEITGMGS